MDIATGAAHFSVSARGTLVYIEDVGAVAATNRTLTWVDRNGRETAIKAPARAYRHPRLSADGQRIVVDIADEQRDVWIWSLAGETLTRLTVDSATDGWGVWTPDGRRVIFNSTRAGSRGIAIGNLYWQASDGTGAAERLTDSPNNHMPNAVTPDGTKLVVREVTADGSDLLLLPLQGERRTQPLVQTPFTERNADISPDGRWLAYESNESGEFEVYVRPFPNVNDGRWQVSTGGGTVPLWARNGREMFFMTLRGESLMAAAILESPGSAAFRSGTPITLFDTRGYFAPTGGPNQRDPGRTYDVSADGRRFLMIKDAFSARRDVGTSVDHGHPELDRRGQTAREPAMMGDRLSKGRAVAEQNVARRGFVTSGGVPNRRMKERPRPDGLRDTYDRIAEDWARDHERDTWWLECAAKFASLLPQDARVLDAGCGSGQKAKFFQDRGARVLGIDFSEKLLEIARQTATASDFRLLDLRDIRTLSEEFEGVFAQASLLHIPKTETFSVIEGMVSRLVPRGLLYIAVKAQRRGDPEEEIVTENDYGYDYERYFSYYTMDEMRAYVDRLGLSIVHAEVVQASSRSEWLQIIARKP